MSSPTSGYVYVLQMEGHPYYKIGRTNNLNRRITQISPQMPGKLRVISALKVRNIYKSEGALHEDFKNARLNGEWFQLGADDLAQIRLHLLVDQSFLLNERLLGAIITEGRTVSGMRRLARVAALLSRSVLRTQRRMDRYFAFIHKRTETSSVDTILNAEFVE